LELGEPFRKVRNSSTLKPGISHELIELIFIEEEEALKIV
jgi:hypothetical protein